MAHNPLPLLLLPLLLLHHLPLSSSTYPPQFEGFDADDDVTSAHDDVIFTTPPPPPTSLSPSPESKPLVSSAAPIDVWDEDEFEGIFTPPEMVLENSEENEKTNFVTPADVDSNSGPDLSDGSVRDVQKSVLDYYVEILSVSFLCIFLINYFAGKRQNEGLALAWATKFAGKDSIFEKNFSLLGIGEGEDSPLLLKEGQTTFLFYASERSFYQGMLATMELKSRHLISRLYNCVVPCKDEMTIEVFLNDEAMDHVVFALARKKMAKSMQKEVIDLQRFAVMVATPSGRKWVANELTVVAEPKEGRCDYLGSIGSGVW